MRIWIKSFLPRTLFGRALLIIVTPLILLQLVTTHIFYDRHWDTITWRLTSAIAGDIAIVLDSLRQEDTEVAKRAKLFDAMHRHLGLQMTLIPGAILPNESTKTNKLLDRMLMRAMDEQVHWPYRIDTSAYRKQVVIDVQLPEAVLRTVAPGKRLFSSTTYIFIMWMIGTSLILFAVASIFMRNQIRPIRRLARAVDRMGKGRDIEEEFKIEGATEVRQTAQAFELMRDRIRGQMRQRTDMLSGVSHDLRTPLTRMKLQLAMSDDGAVNELKSDVEEMEHMIDGYLAFARGEGDEPAIETDIAELVEESVGAWKRDSITIDCHIEDRLVASVKPQSIRRCLGNLIANARRYADRVWVQAGRRGDQIEITIDDDGPGIAENHREDVFKPFFRLDQSRNPETGGTGLGLAIARDVTRGHGGDIILEESPQGGLRARIKLPI